jgi:hypothetical protein
VRSLLPSHVYDVEFFLLSLLQLALAAVVRFSALFYICTFATAVLKQQYIDFSEISFLCTTTSLGLFLYHCVFHDKRTVK